MTDNIFIKKIDGFDVIDRVVNYLNERKGSATVGTLVGVAALTEILPDSFKDAKKPIYLALASQYGLLANKEQDISTKNVLEQTSKMYKNLSGYFDFK